MPRILVALLPLACAALPMGTPASARDKSAADRPPCVTLPPMAKGKKCRELPAMARPDAPKRERDTLSPFLRPQPIVLPMSTFSQ